MTDQRPDIDIEAEREDFETFNNGDGGLGLPLSLSQQKGRTYAIWHTEMAFLAFCRRARIAAEREREWKRRYDKVVRDYEDYVNAENEAVMKRVTELEAFVRNSFCECYDEYGNPKPQPCERCQLLGEDGRVEL